MMGGVYLGGYYTGDKNKVPTFVFNTNGDYYYCCIELQMDYKLKKLNSFKDYETMYYAAPIILAFWSDEE